MQITVSLQLLERHPKPRTLTVEQAGFSPRLPILLATLVGRALATIVILKNRGFSQCKTRLQYTIFEKSPSSCNKTSYYRKGDCWFNCWHCNFQQMRAFQSGVTSTSTLDYCELSSK